jgi:aspartyl-tRNA(Asn)/glutamyl-tRNA(Gln) amidotransferase subunit A
MSDLTGLTLTEARDGLGRRDFSARELTEAHLGAIGRLRHLNAFITETPELALEQAAEADRRIAKGEARALEGLPIAIKDLFCTGGVRTTAGSRILHDFVPFYESTVSRKLLEAGAVMVGKTNLDEFAMGSANVTSHFGHVVSPWTRAGEAPLVPGGSSGGSAAAVAARLALGATGTDTGGSIRQPASFCGIVGMKPTYGRCSRFGIVAFASSLDQAGPLTRTVRDAAVMLEVMSGYDSSDSTSANLPVPGWEASLGEAVRGLRIGVPKEYRMPGMPGAIERIWQQGADWLRDAGCELVEISLPHTKYALPTYYIIAPAEASSNLARYDGMRYGLRAEADDLEGVYSRTRAEGFGAEVKRRVLIGTYVLSAGYYDAYYLKAQRVRRLVADDFSRAFAEVDAVLTPTAPSAAFRVGEKEDDPVAMYLNDVFAVPASLAGLPAASVPGGLSDDGLPLGLQVVGRPWDEAVVLRLAQALEDAAAFDAVPYGLEAGHG